MKRALAPLAAVLGLKPEGLPAMSTDTAPWFVSASSEYYPAPPDGAFDPGGDYSFMGWIKLSSEGIGEVGGFRTDVCPNTTREVYVGLPEVGGRVEE